MCFLMVNDYAKAEEQLWSCDPEDADTLYLQFCLASAIGTSPSRPLFCQLICLGLGQVDQGRPLQLSPKYLSTEGAAQLAMQSRSSGKPRAAPRST